MGESYEALFETKQAKGRLAYKLFACSMLVGICSIWLYRATHAPGWGEEGRWAWMGIFAAELWFGFYWIITQSVRWNPIYRFTHPEKLSQRDEAELPNVDIFVCTADPIAEPPILVISTVLSTMAYNYSPEKLSVYLSDDAGSILTFYALWEASHFAKHWLPFCKKYNVEPRSPAAYFSKLCNPRDACIPTEWSSMKNLYEEMADRIDSIVMLGKIPEELRANKGFSEWSSEMTSRNHPPIVQILIDGRDQCSIDNDGNALPTLVYMAREKRPQHHHNFKAGSMNALIRASSEISDSPITLNLDCDMYSNNSESVRHALCFFLDEEKGQDIGFVQYPQIFDNVTKNDLYGYSFNVFTEVEFPGFDNWGGPPYIGTGCFHRREILCGKKYSKDYKEDWKRGIDRKTAKSACILEERAKSLITCTYEHNTQWGQEIGLKYDCPVEDVITGLSIQCRGWKSVYISPSRKAFLGVAPTTLAQSLVQFKRWSEGNFQIFLSKYCPFILGRGKIKLGLQMAYCVYGLWAPNSLPTLYYLVIPSLCLLKGISLFPKITSPWFMSFAYVTIGKHVYGLVESLQCGDTLAGWWNFQRMWILRRTTSFLYGITSTILKLLRISEMGFAITAKVSDGDASKRYEQDVLEFGSSSSMFVIIGAVAMLNLFCLVGGLQRLVVDGGIMGLEPLFIQILLCGLVVAIHLPIYEALFIRKDKGSFPFSVTFLSFGFAMLVSLLTMV
ncbi:cellulose synthase-like protein E6 [Phoenix dactylifera]|uniref:Cellulose synthase-like protein E6 n=1 Tax=Phoenix dactylifera TaxID=42345 RepID=A0A8B8ZRQ6_PHODC|nr:cellulose synthase-like protein E6 [Phoenix dactylifera]